MKHDCYLGGNIALNCITLLIYHKEVVEMDGRSAKGTIDSHDDNLN